MQGAVAGTPGTLPTNWQQNSGTVAVNVVGTGTENGITYIDLQFVGTPNQTFANVRFEPNTQIVAANNQAWTNSFYVRAVAGSTNNITDIDNRIYFRDAGGVGLQEAGVSVLSLLSNSSINNARTTNSQTAANASIVRVNSGINLNLTVSAAIDITLRIGLPQLEQGAFATSVIPTTTTALTRNADVASMTGANFSSWFNATEGTLYAESFRTPTAAASTFPSYAEFDNGTTNRYGVYNSQAGSTNEYRLFVQDAGVSQADIGGVASRVAAGTVVKQAAAFAANDFALSVNGSSVFTDTAGTLPSSVNRMSIGSSYIAANFANAWIRRVSYYPRRLPDSTLQALTA